MLKLRPGERPLLSPFLGGNLTHQSNQLRTSNPAGFAWRQDRPNDRDPRPAWAIFYAARGLVASGPTRGTRRLPAAILVTPDVQTRFSEFRGSVNSLLLHWQILLPYGTFLKMPAPRSVLRKMPCSRATELCPRSTFQSRQARWAPIYPYAFPTAQAQHFNVGFNTNLWAGVVVPCRFSCIGVTLSTLTPGGLLGH